MTMLRWFVNFGLLVLPIAVTLGVLLALEQNRSASGQPPLFDPPDNNGNGGGPRITKDIDHQRYCDKAMGIHPISKGQEYTLNPNQWGWEEGDEGGLCMNVTVFENGTYPHKLSAPEFSVTWQYPMANDSNMPVHAFPNVLVDDVFPLRLNEIDAIKLDFDWTYGLGNKTAKKTDVTKLEAKNVNANVAMDMFLHKNKDKSGSSKDASHEIMVWFAAIGPATQPIGMPEKNKIMTKTLNGTDFILYSGTNSEEQSVLTWYADTPAEHFKGDLMPLIEEILSTPKQASFDPPDKTYYLGYMSLGSEAYWSPQFVTFHVPTLEIDVQKK